MDKQVLAAVSPTYSVVAFPAAKLPTEYEALVYSRWLRSLRFGNPLFKNVDSDAFYKNYHPFIKSLMQKPDALIKMAVIPEDQTGPEVVLGFSASREDVLDYVHVHKDHRNQGIAKKLLPKKFTAFSHATLTALLIWQSNKKYKHLKFNPFA